MTRLVGLDIEPFRLPFRLPLRTARATITERTGAVVTLTTSDGRTGFGEAAPLPAFSTGSWDDTTAALRAARSRWTDCAAPTSAAAVEDHLTQDADLAALLLQSPAARFALESALLDLVAQQHGVSIARLLNPDAARSVTVNALLSARDPAALADEARTAVAAGFRTLKLKVAGAPLTDDLARIRSLRAAVGPEIRLRLDANGGWDEDEAKTALAAVASFGVELCEQPVAVGQPDALNRLQHAAAFPLAADESAADPTDLAALLATDPTGVGVFVLKPAILGGLLPTRLLAERIRSLGGRVFVTTMLDGAVGRLAALHLSAALGGDLAHGLATGRLLASDVGPDPAPPIAGRMTVPDRPGLGWPAP